MLNKLGFRLFFIFLIQIYCLNIFAQKFTVTPSSLKVSTDQSFKIEYRVDDIQNPNMKLPPFEDFAIVGGPNNYQSMQIVNGKMSQYQSVSYVLQPRKAGDFKIKPATLTHKGKTYKTKPVTIRVTQGKQNPQAQANSGNQATAKANSSFDLPKGAKDYMFLVAETDTNSFFMGEQITVKYNLYTKYDVTNYQMEENPTFTGFWVQDLTPQRINNTRKIVNGETYLVYPLKTYALFAQKSGEIPLFEINATITYREATGQQRGFFQNYRSRKLMVKNKATKIKVFPLPDEGKPDDFTGAVGKFGCSVKTDKRTCEVNEAITINVNVNGTGNLMLIEPSKLEFPEAFDVYEPEMNENIYERSTKITGSKNYEYVVVPTEEGTFKLPAVPFSYFDPEEQKYKSIRGRETTITVKPSTNPALKEKPKEAEKDIADISLSTSLKGSASRAMIWMPVLGLLYAIPFFLFPSIIKNRRRAEEEAKDVVGKKRREALVAARKRLETAKVHLNKNEKKPFYSETIQAIWGYISDKLNLQTSELSKDNARQLLLKEGIKANLVEELISTIEYCEMAIYAPVPGADQLENTYNNTLRIIADIEEGVSGQGA